MPNVEYAVFLFIYLFIGLSGSTVQSTIVYGANLFYAWNARGVRHLWKSRTLAQKSLEITTEIIGNQEIRLHARNLE